MYKLRPYQLEAVQATLKHFRKEKTPAVVVLPTGAGKSLVIAELARLAKGRVLVLAHVKELVEQNHAKYISFGLEAGIYSAGLQRKDMDQKVIFGSIQSIARAPEDFFDSFSLLVIDECHRVSVQDDTQYFQVISKLQKSNPEICILGLTATPYRLGLGWIYQYNEHTKTLQTDEERFFKKCIYELTIRYMIKNKYLTMPVKIDSPVACYDFSSLKLHGTSYVAAQVEAVLKDQSRITPLIIKNIIDMAKERQGVMIFTSSVTHAIEIMKNLPPYIAALVVGDTPGPDRDEIIEAFKCRKLKYLVNVSVLTTGFDAPHVDVIAILRPTESVSLYQQIIGRGLRLSAGKTDCLILDYTGQGHGLFSPEIDEDRPSSESEIVDVPCPQCGVINHFWGVRDHEGQIKEHFGRKCKGAFEDPVTHQIEACGFLFRFKRCEKCGAENDIAARSCKSCENVLVDNDKKLKEAMSLKDAHVLRVETMTFTKGHDKKGQDRLEVRYYDHSAQFLTEYFYLDSQENCHAFYFNFIRMHNRLPERKIFVRNVDEALKYVPEFRKPLFVVARKVKHFWAIREKIFE
ncbi:ATP-dependent helicase [Bdellovibrio bacteriovorus]|uniref:ATP-dependent helicase n=1 Tax=Bdellovibrio bacteriovorus TaxID=959 RepID=A0A162GYA5_BDEBC|nr:DEAD/DEAH box helicase family protein [Bdellovibrio bacteriovorus]KYG69217.1 ATP-dependent helicase [Bdellovibrio bacteriovorus]